MGAVALIRAPLWYNQQGKAGFTKGGQGRTRTYRAGKESEVPFLLGGAASINSAGEPASSEGRRTLAWLSWVTRAGGGVLCSFPWCPVQGGGCALRVSPPADRTREACRTASRLLRFFNCPTCAQSTRRAFLQSDIMGGTGPWTPGSLLVASCPPNWSRG